MAPFSWHVYPYKCKPWIVLFAFIVILTLTSEVSLWQFLHERAMAEKVRSGWSNLLLLALRRNVVKGSCRESKLDITKIKDAQPYLKSSSSFSTLLICISIATMLIDAMQISVQFQFSGLPCSLLKYMLTVWIIHIISLLFFSRWQTKGSLQRSVIHCIQAWGRIN